MNTTETQLYLALRAIAQDYRQGAESGDWGNITEDEGYQKIMAAADAAILQFETALGPLPEWAIGWNLPREVFPGAQLATKDGRRSGNAHVLRGPYKSAYSGSLMYDCITDAGSYIEGLSLVEIEEGFWIGEFISDPKTLIARFGNHGEDYGVNHEPA